MLKLHLKQISKTIYQSSRLPAFVKDTVCIIKIIVFKKNKIQINSIFTPHTHKNT